MDKQAGNQTATSGSGATVSGDDDVSEMAPPPPPPPPPPEVMLIIHYSLIFHVTIHVNQSSILLMVTSTCIVVIN